MARLDGITCFFKERWKALLITSVVLVLFQVLFWDGSAHRAAESRIPALSRIPTIPPLYEPSPILPSTIALWEASNTTEEIALCLAVKDQYADLAEWLVHHYNHHGIRRFYIMDDGSTPPLAERDYSKIIDERAITHRYYLPALRSEWPQMRMYHDCMRLFSHNHKWMGFLDADEFLQAKKPYTLSSMLKNLDSNKTVGALGINWKMHNSNGLLHRPTTTIRKAFTSCLKEDPVDHGSKWGTSNQHIKVFVKTGAFKNPRSPHKMDLRDGFITVGENGDEITRHAWRVPSTKNKLAIHHYGLKSREEFEEKMRRGNAMNDAKRDKFWEEQEAWPREECLEMAEYEP